MSVLIFVIILIVLILIHEFGHFIVAKKSGIRVDEFGIGFPPKLWGKKFGGETEYSINAIPFGGFVKIFGENPDGDSIDGPDSKRSFTNQPKHIQAGVIFAGVFFNIIFAWALISTGFMIGLPTSVDNPPAGASISNPHLVVVGVLPNSPAESVGIAIGDTIFEVKTKTEFISKPTVESFQNFIKNNSTNEIVITHGLNEDQKENVIVTPESGIVDNELAIGVAIDYVGKAMLPVHLALWEGMKTTIVLTEATFFALADFFKGIFMGTADLSSISGPVGIVGIVGDANTLGIASLILLTALISINLAIINLMPFPALDGGRLLFLAIEKIKGSRINPKIANTINNVGFAFLILLMLAVTYSDISKILVG